MHPNDTLQGRLMAWVRPQDKEGDDPIYQKFGYWRMVEARMIRATWPGPGEPTPFDITAAIEANHADDPTIRERGMARRQRADGDAEAWDLTPEEWAYLAEHFAGANDPTAQTILRKALAR